MFAVNEMKHQQPLSQLAIVKNVADCIFLFISGTTISILDTEMTFEERPKDDF